MKSPYAITVAEITFKTSHEMERWLAKQGWRVSRWNVDGTFDTEPIPGDSRGVGDNHGNTR